MNGVAVVLIKSADWAVQRELGGLRLQKYSAEIISPCSGPTSIPVCAENMFLLNSTMRIIMRPGVIEASVNEKIMEFFPQFELWNSQNNRPYGFL